MSPNDNTGADDFVLIDSPAAIVPLAKSPVETDYVTVNTDDSIIVAEQNNGAVPTPDKQPMVEFECFQPMLLSSFPEQITKVPLLVPDTTTKHKAPEEKVNKPSSPVNSHTVLIKNASLFLECLFHFKGLYPIIGRNNTFWAVGKSCGLKAERERWTVLEQRVGCTLNTLRDSRAAFLRMSKDSCVPNADDPDVRELARLVDQYIIFERSAPSEPKKIDEKWWTGQAFKDLWFEWQDILKKNGLRVTQGQGNTAFTQSTDSTGPESSSLISDAILAAGKLKDALMRVKARRGSNELSETEKQVAERVLQHVTRWTDKINNSHKH